MNTLVKMDWKCGKASITILPVLGGGCSNVWLCCCFVFDFHSQTKFIVISMYWKSINVEFSVNQLWWFSSILYIKIFCSWVYLLGVLSHTIWWECFQSLKHQGFENVYPINWHFWIFHLKCSPEQHSVMLNILLYQIIFPLGAPSRWVMVFDISKISHFNCVQ